MGGHDHLWGWLYNNRGAMRERQGLLSEALEDARRAVSAKEKAEGPDSPDVAMSLSNMALAIEQMGDSNSAVHQAQRAADTIEARLGRDHPRTGILRSNYAEILNHVGRFAEAREMATRALGALEGESAADGLILSYPLMALGVALLGEGRAAEAIPILERAVAIRGSKESQPSRRGEARFALARALWTAAQDGARARVLARLARSEYLAPPLAPGGAQEIERIDAWLSSLGSDA
jgi:tetratricopeptide (TPR) repeat protein